MILLIAILTGLLAGVIRAWHGKRKLLAPQLRYLWIVPLAFLPQFIAFELRLTSQQFPDRWIPVVLVGSQVLLLIFAVLNYRQPGFILLCIGLSLNLIVIVVNGGWMPISLQVIRRLVPDLPIETWQVGERFGTSKDKILSLDDTHLWWLSDWLVLPRWIPYPVAFSFGDVILSIGAFYFLWSLGREEVSLKA